MMIINFSHPLTDLQKEQIETLSGRAITTIHTIPCQFDNTQPFAPQVADYVSQVPLTPAGWQTEYLLINPPSYAPATATLIAELHGRMGYFPAIIRTRPVPQSLPPQFEIAEILNLHEVRHASRQKRRQI